MMKKIFISLSLLLLTSLSVSAQKIDQRLTKLVEQTALHRAQGTALPFAPKDVNKSIAVDFRADGTIAALSAIATLKEGAECPTERLQQMGIEVRFQIGDMVALRIPADKLAALEGIEEFRYVKADEVMQKDNEKARIATGVELVNTAEKAAAQQLPKAYTGEGVVLGIIDGGIDFNHAAFRNPDGSTRIKKAVVFEKEGESAVKRIYTTEADIKGLTYDANDDSHGTHTSAIAGGSDTGNGQQGMAPQADLVLCGLGDWLSTVNIQDCIKEIFDYAKSVGKPAVVSISLGNPLGLHDGSEGVCKTVNELTKNGTEEGRVVVISSSNAAANCQSIIKPLNKANADANGFELKTVLGASKTKTDRADLPVRYNDNYFIYADDYQKFDVRYAVVDIKTGEFVGTDHLKDIGTNGQVQILDAKNIIGYNEEPTAAGGNAYEYMFNFRSHPVYLDNVDYRLVLLLKGSHDGQTIKLICNGDNSAEPCFSAPVVEGGYNFRDNGYTRGNGDLTISTSICSDYIIGIGSYITRDKWTDYLGNPRKYIESAVTNKLQVVGEISDFSSYGVDDNGKPRPTAIAPGQGIISAGNNWDREIFYDNQAGVPHPSKDGLAYLCQNVEKNKRSNWYILSQGTSMACPVAAGIIALWMQAKPSLTVNEINAILKETCVNDEWTTNTANIPSVNKVQAGYGKINALAGLKKILGTVGIETISADGHREATPATMYSTDAPVYNMMGQRVSKSQKGLVIYKGRKYLNK